MFISKNLWKIYYTSIKIKLRHNQSYYRKNLENDIVCALQIFRIIKCFICVLVVSVIDGIINLTNAYA